MNYQNIIYCRLNLEFPRDIFINEYDRYILPNSVPIVSGKGTWIKSREINKEWKMVDPEVYDKTDVLELDGTITKKGYPDWDATSLIEILSDDLALSKAASVGSVAIRNTVLDTKKYKFKDQYKDLEIVKWIKNLPLTDIIGVRCVSLTPGTFASIHKDSMHKLGNLDKSSIEKNQIWHNGFISITLNITNGGVPLFYSTDDISKPLTADDQCYLFNDYYWHGVPMVNDRRRQIRITARPNQEFEKLLDRNFILQ